MSQTHDFAYYLDNLEVAEWKVTRVGGREAMFNCPAHGGSDTLSVKERTGKDALLFCFGPCGKDAFRLVNEALEGTGDETPQEADEPQPTVRIRRRRTSAAVTASGVSQVDPLDWTAARCAMTREELDGLGLPISGNGGRVVFEFAGVTSVKTRGIGEGKKKDITWTGAANPPLWPVPKDITHEYMILTEGEFDAITLTLPYGEQFMVASITGGSGNVPDASLWEALHARGLKGVYVVFDEDDAGRKGRQEVLEAIRETELEAYIWTVKGLDPTLGEKDVRDVALRLGTAWDVELEAAFDTGGPVPLSHVPSTPPAKLIQRYIHPNEHTILYGDGGTGKGVIAAWWVAKMVEEGMRILVLDYEAHAQHEWRPRIEAFLTDKSLIDNVEIDQPMVPIWDYQPEATRYVRERGFDLVVIDSVTYACVGEAVEDSKTAITYSSSINRLGCGVLSIAHTTKSDRNPSHPFGSTYWHNGARITVAVSRTVEGDPKAPRLLKMWKSNQAHEEPDREVDWSWLDGALPSKLDFTEVQQKKTTVVQSVFEELRAELGRVPTDDEWKAAALAVEPTLNPNTFRTAKRRILKSNRDLGPKGADE